MEGKFIFHPHTRNWPTTLGESSHYTITTSTATASLDNKQDCKIPQSLGSELGMKKTKNNLQTKWKLLSFSFPYFSFLHSPELCYTSPPQLNHLRREKKKYQRAEA